MKKIIDLIKSLLSPGSIASKSLALDELDKEVKQVVVETKEKIEKVKEKVIKPSSQALKSLEEAPIAPKKKKKYYKPKDKAQ